MTDKKNTSRPIIGLSSLTYTLQHEIITIFLLLLLSPTMPFVGAQPPPGARSDQYPYAKFTPSMAIIISVLVAALFFMGFFSIYIRRCSNNAGAGGSIRPILSMRSRRAAATRGLDASVIETFPTFAYSVVKGQKIGKGTLECAVCLNEFEDDEMLRLIPKCDHVFHPECIDEWLTSHVTCPVCRADLVPQPGESTHLHVELNPENHVTEAEDHGNDDVAIQINDNDEVNNNDEVSNNVPAPEPEAVKRNASVRSNRPPRSRSVKPRLFGKFRSHSTGHSLVQPGENVDRFTLRLPEDVRKKVMQRALLNRTASSVVVLPREGSSRRGYRTGEGSSRGKSYRRLESLDRVGRSDRWAFSRMPSFLTRALSGRSTKVVAGEAEPSTSSALPPKPKGVATASKGDETGLVSPDSAMPPV